MKTLLIMDQTDSSPGDPGEVAVQLPPGLLHARGLALPLLEEAPRACADGEVGSMRMGRRSTGRRGIRMEMGRESADLS